MYRENEKINIKINIECAREFVCDKQKKST